tara:strand:+ start:433 stop:879 length:447 start_codon:yes stop_codon:yes gene_type:complete
MAFRKLVGSYKDYNLSTHILEDGYLAVDVDSGSLRLGDGSTAGGIEVSAGGGGGSSTSLGDLTAVGSTLSAPSDADLILTTAGSGNINISNAYTLPSSDGSANQVLQTNGSGVLSFATVSGGGSGSLDGGTAASTYGGITAIDGGTAE